MQYETIEELMGYTLTNVERKEDDGDDMLVFHRGDSKQVLMYHDQDCCECVYIEDVDGDLEDLVGSPIIEAEEASRFAEENEVGEEGTWTFYKLGTAKGSVSIRWLGESNGYYSERVDIVVRGS